MPPTVLTIGNFDGVHTGHHAILQRARAAADSAGATVTALAFHPHPATLLRPTAAPALLTTFEQRNRLLREAGADHVERLEPTPELLARSPADFIDALVERFAPIAIVEGADFRFGSARAGDTNTLRELARDRAFDVHIVEPVDATMSDQHLVRASSTHARWLIERGRMRDAHLLLGRPYALTGQVVQGDQRGRTIGCPTANLTTPNLLPANGVYAGAAHLPNGTTMPAAIHIGPRDTFDQPQRVVEAHILDWQGPDPAAAEPEYDWPLTLDITAWLRDLARFEGVDPLIAQINRDITRTRELTIA